LHRLLIIEQNPESYRQILQKEIPDLEIYLLEDVKKDPGLIATLDIFLAGKVDGKFPEELLKPASRLQWIQSTLAGVDHIVRSPFLRDEILLTRVGGVFGRFMAEYVLGYLLYLVLRIAYVIENQKKAHWEPFMPGTLEGRVMGILGLGEIGSEIARKAKEFGMKVLGLKRTAGHYPYVDRLFLESQLSEFLPQVDFLVITVPLTPRTQGMIRAQELRLMKRDAYLINIARGAVVREEDLIQALEENWIAGAILDVFEREPLPKESRLWNLKNVIITPHISGPDDPIRVSQVFCENYRRFRAKESLHYLVDKHRGY
jgi:phosphoglycerate dehydrogenase-like enzyme